MAIEYAALDAKGKAEENGQNLVRAMSTMAESNAAQFGRVELWAVEQEKRMQEMERKLSRKEMKQDQQAQAMNLKLEKERLRRKALKDSAKATAREKVVLRQRSDGLEAAISKLAWEMKEGKNESAKRTVKRAKKTAKALSDRIASQNPALSASEEENPEPSAPPPPPPTAPAVPPTAPAAPPTAPAVPPTAPQVPKTPDASGGGGGGKGKGKGRQAASPDPSDSSSSSSSSSADSDSDGHNTMESYGTMASLLKDKRREWKSREVVIHRG